MKCKLLNLLFIACFFFSSCSKTGTNEGSFTSGPNWTLTVDGKKYSWSGPIVPTASNNGQASYVGTLGISPSADLLMMSNTVAGLPSQEITISLTSVGTGTFMMTPSTFLNGPSIGNTFILILENSKTYSSIAPGSNITFKVNSLSNKTVVADGLIGAGYVSGNFYGTIGEVLGDEMHTISGTFNCLRLE